MATSGNYELFKMSGPRNPYPGVNGVVAEGALADLLLVKGNPLKNIDLIADPEANFVLIMKDGVIYKNSAGQEWTGVATASAAPGDGPDAALI